MMTMFRRRLSRTILCATFAVVPLFASSARSSSAAVVAYVDCPWSPYKEAWACALPSNFEEGRFNAPPDFRQDAASVQARQQTWTEAKAEAGARSHGRVGVFVPASDGSWMFVPGSSWSPGDPVFLPAAKTARNH